MKLVITILLAALSFLMGAFGFSQIIGSIQNVKKRGVGKTIITAGLWLLILAALVFLVLKVASPYRYACYSGLAISFVQILFSGKIR